MLDDGALDGALLRAGVGDKTTMFCWTLAPVAYDIHTPVVTVAVHPAAEMPQADFVGCGCRISYGGERMPLPAQPRGRLVDCGSLQRAGYCSRLQPRHHGTRLYRRRRPVATGNRDAPLSARGEA